MTPATLTFTTAHLTVLTAEDGGGPQGDMVGERPVGLCATRPEVTGAWESIDVQPEDDEHVSLWSSNGFALSAEGDAEGKPVGIAVFNRTEVGAWERWRIVRLGDGIAFAAYDGESYLVAEPDGVITVRRPGHSGEPGAWETYIPSDWSWLEAPPSVGDVGSGAVKPINGYLRLQGMSFADDSGPRIIHGATWFPGLCIARENFDEYLRQLDRAVPHVQYLRVGWRINGTPWADANLTIDPIKQSGYEDLLYRAITAFWDRKLRICLTCCDMYNWTDSEAEHWWKRVFEIAASVSQEVVCCNDGLNEMRGTHPSGEDDSAVEQMQGLLYLAREVYPWGQCGLSDPGNQAGDGMARLSPSPATICQIHDVRWAVEDAFRHAFNTRHESGVKKPIHQREPTGPDSPGGWPNGMVYQPVNEPENLLGIYMLHVITGQMSTYFSDPALVNRAPLDSTWGFKELAQTYHEAEIPQDIGQGQTKPGHHTDAPLDVMGSGAARADGVIAPSGDVYFGVVSGGWEGSTRYNVKSRWTADVVDITVNGLANPRVVSAGQVAVSGAVTFPTVVRMVRR